jgi:hypothetical protein
MTNEAKQVALEYIEACGRKDYDTVSRLLSPSMTFVGPGNALTGAAPYLAVFQRLGPVWSRSDVKKVFVDGDEVVVIYDFVTDTPAGAVPIVEWLRVEDGQIASVILILRPGHVQAGSRQARASRRSMSHLRLLRS